MENYYIRRGNSASVAVMDRGNIVYSEGFGPADRSLNRLVDRDTRFNIGSTSKMFAAVAILLLADDGKLSLEDPVVKHIPEFVMKDPRYRDITVRMLFNHSSGLPGSTFVFGYRADEDHQTLLLETLKNAVLKHTPGEMSIYCNDGFTLAEIIVERVSGKSFASFVTERIFSPLEMRNSGESVGVTGGKIAEFYDEEGNKYPPEVVTVLGAGGLSSTPEDLCRFGDSFAPGGMNILSDSSLKDVLKEQPTPFSSLLKGGCPFRCLRLGLCTPSSLPGERVPGSGQERRDLVLFNQSPDPSTGTAGGCSDVLRTSWRRKSYAPYYGGAHEGQGAPRTETGFSSQTSRTTAHSR